LCEASSDSSSAMEHQIAGEGPQFAKKLTERWLDVCSKENTRTAMAASAAARVATMDRS
jgi:hypothetical protein